MKRFIAIMLLAAVACSFAACAGNEKPTQSNAPTQSPIATESTNEPKLPFDVIISEVMPDNEGLYLGHDQDWVELHNRGDEDASLDGYYLTDDMSKKKLDLSSRSIPAGGFLVITLDGEAPFRLSDNETVYLLYGGETAWSVSYEKAYADVTFDKDGVCPFVTPGFQNTEDGYEAYLKTVKLPELIINEVISSNSKHLPVGGKYYDLVEIYNNSDRDIDLAQYTFSDKRSEPDRYRFPDVKLEAGGYYVIYCSGDTTLGQKHAPFKISSDGETVYLAKDGVIFDRVTVPEDVVSNESYGRTEEGFAYFSTPTVGKENGKGYETNISSPAASHASGVYQQEITVALEASGTVYYTLDGSRPTSASKVYTEPIKISDVTCIRTFCKEDGRSSALATYTYVINKAHDLPVVVLSIPQNSLTGEKGVLNNVNRSYEYEAVVTLIEDGQEKFSVPCGFRLHGNSSRNGAKQNFQLRFRSKYGVGKLRYPLFDERDITEFNSLLLKGGSEDWSYAVLRDEFASMIVDGNTHLYTLAVKPVVLYLGGEYWGIYYMRERFDEDYVASHMNVSPESADVLESTAGYVENGSDTAFKEIKSYIKTHDMSKTESYEYLAERIDVTSLLDWYICRSYMGDKDLANIRRFRSTEGDGKWRWMWYDLDWAFYHTTDKPLSGLVNNANGEPAIIRALLKSKEGKEALLVRYAELLDTVLNDEYFNMVLDKIVGAIETEIPKDRARWGVSVSRWQSSIKQIRNYTKDNARTNRVLSDLKSYFKLTDEQMKEYFGEHYQG